MAYKNKIERLIFDTAKHADADQIKQMLSIYGKNPDLLDVIIKGCDAGAKIYASHYVGPKEEAIRDFCLANDVTSSVKKYDSSLADLFKMVADIGARLEKIETTVANIGKRKTRGLNA